MPSIVSALPSFRIFTFVPTLTDNNGRPIYGIVRGGKEIQLDPEPELSVR